MTWVTFQYSPFKICYLNQDSAVVSKIKIYNKVLFSAELQPGHGKKTETKKEIKEAKKHTLKLVHRKTTKPFQPYRRCKTWTTLSSVALLRLGERVLNLWEAEWKQTNVEPCWKEIMYICLMWKRSVSVTSHGSPVKLNAGPLCRTQTSKTDDRLTFVNNLSWLRCNCSIKKKFWCVAYIDSIVSATLYLGFGVWLFFKQIPSFLYHTLLNLLKEASSPQINCRCWSHHQHWLKLSPRATARTLTNTLSHHYHRGYRCLRSTTH